MTRHRERETLAAHRQCRFLHTASQDSRLLEWVPCLDRLVLFHSPYLKQETMCASPNFTNAGSYSLQMFILTVHLGSNGQPRSGKDAGDEFPGITGSSFLRFFSVSAEIVGRDSNKARV